MKQLTTQQLVDAYLSEVRHTAAPTTMDNYEKRFCRFLNFVQNKPVTRELITEWINLMIKSGLKASSVIAYRRTVKGMYSWAEDEGLVTESPVPRRLRITAAAVQKVPIRGVDHKMILDQCLMEKHNFWSYATRTAWETGLRLTDIACLRKDQVDILHSCINLVPCKTKRFGKLLQIPVSVDLLSLFYIYEEEGSPYVCQDMKDWWDSGGTKTLSSMFIRLLKKAGVWQKGMSFHSYRWGLVTRLIEKGVSAELVSQITGQNLARVMAYTKIDMDTKRKALGLCT